MSFFFCKAEVDFTLLLAISDLFDRAKKKFINEPSCSTDHGSASLPETAQRGGNSVVERNYACYDDPGYQQEMGI